MLQQNPQALDSEFQYKNACSFLLRTLAENILEHPDHELKISEYQPKPEQNYQVFVDYWEDNILIFANSDETYREIVSKLQILPTYLKTHYGKDFTLEYESGYKVVGFKFTIEHLKIIYGEVSEAVHPEQKKPEPLYSKLLEILYTLEMILEERPRANRKNFIEYLATTDVVPIDNNERIETASPIAKTTFFIPHTVNTEDPQQLKDAAASLIRFYTWLDPDMAESLAGDQLLKVIILKKSKHNKILVQWESAKLSGIDEYKLNDEIYFDMPDDCSCKQKLIENTDDANKILRKVETLLRQQLADLYQEKYRNTPTDRLIIPLSLSAYSKRGYDCQQILNTIYIQCQVQYLFLDLFALYPVTKETLEKFTSGVIEIPYYISPEIILEKMGFYLPGQYSMNDLGLQTSQLCPAWEYGLTVQATDNILDFYKTKLNKAMNGIQGQICVPLPNLALFYLLSATEPENKLSHQQLLASISQAVTLVKAHDLIIPKKYQYLIMNSGLLTAFEQEQHEKRYHAEHQRQLQLLKDYQLTIAVQTKGSLVANSTFAVASTSDAPAAITTLQVSATCSIQKN